MKNKNIVFISSLLAVILSAIIITSCNKKFDEPPGYIAPTITANTTIKALKALHTSGGYELINSDLIISGVVIANDKSGNLYKEMFIQDATGSISVEMDASNVFAQYPVGRTIFIKCKGLYLSDYGGMIQLGMIDRSVPNNPAITGIVSALFDTYIVKGALGANVPVSQVASIAALNTGLQDSILGTLIQLNGYEIPKGDTSRLYSDTSSSKKSVNITLQDCGGVNKIIMRTSGYANFAGSKLPKGKGNIIALYTVFNGTKQLVLRDTTDIQFTDPRCNIFEEDFQSFATTGTVALSIPNWKNITETGDVPYTLAAFSTNTFAKVSAFSSAVLPTTNISSWLISPDITIPAGTTPKYSFTCSRRYPSGTLKAYVSTNYTGTNLSTATWTLLTSVPAGTATAFTAFDTFGPYSFTAYAGQKINVAFRYEAASGTAPSAVATYEVDDIKVSRN